LLAQWACFDLGCPFVPLSSRNLSNGRETIHMLKTAEINAIIAADSQVANWLEELINGSGMSISLKVCVAEQKPLSNWLTFSTLLSSHVSYPNGLHFDVPTHDPEHIALIMFTSGTTSLPKACPHTHRSVIANIRGHIERSNVDSTGVYCAVMLNNHMNGCLAPLAYLCMGGTVVYPDQNFKAASMLTALQQERCTNTIFVPTTLQAMPHIRCGLTHTTHCAHHSKSR
jgi:acyl-CoA synthetase (AMP-forming)/AMP-acid ligase II